MLAEEVEMNKTDLLSYPITDLGSAIAREQLIGKTESLSFAGESFQRVLEIVESLIEQNLDPMKTSII